MVMLALVASAFLSHAWGSHPGPLDRKVYAEGGWTVEIRHDTFSDQTSCRLSGSRMIYQAGAIGFDTRRHRGLTNTFFKVDGGGARRWQELYPDLLNAGVRMETGGIDDPTGGVVWLPVGLVQTAHEVAIESQTPLRPTVSRFRLSGFAGMWAAALRLGCPSDGFVV